MDKETLLKMDPHILVSMVNMKLRDFYGNLNAYCDDLGINRDEIESKLLCAGYKYNNELNQFK